MQPRNEKCGMSLFCGTEVSLDSEVNTECAALKPERSQVGDVLGHGHFDQAEKIGIELACDSLLPRRNSDLNVVQTVNQKLGRIHT